MDRIMVFRVPDWSVHAHRLELHLDPHRPIALTHRHLVVACSASAQAEGVRSGLREREALLRCPDLHVSPHDPDIDARRFAPLFAALTSVVPRIEVVRAGLVAMGARGAARYYGGEAEAAAAMRDLARRMDLPEARIGIADGRFAAEQAATADVRPPVGDTPAAGVSIVHPGRSAAFLAPLPVSRAVDADAAALLAGLGIHTLGALAALPEASVRARFGSPGVAAHRRASGTDSTPAGGIRPTDPERQLAEQVDLEPPLDTADQLAFACRSAVDRLAAALREERLVCTALRVELVDDLGARQSREWAHPGHFSPADILARIRWQAATVPRDEERTGAGIVSVRLIPVGTDAAASHEPGLWHSGPDERVHHRLSRAQGLLGPAGVVTAALTGGRLLRDRQRLTPWGSASRLVSVPGPWPGALPAPHPTLVYDPPLPVDLLDAAGDPVGIDADDLLTASPARLRVDGRALPGPVRGWSHPWPIRERWWEGRAPRARLQLELVDGDAWLLLHERGRWVAEGRYD